MAERCTDPRGNRQHRGDPGHDLHVEHTPRWRTRFDLLANRRRHGEYAGIAATHQGNLASGCCAFESGTRPQCLLAVVRWIPTLTCTNGRAVEIRSVAEQRIGGGQGGIRVRREPACISGAKPDDRKSSAHDRASQPGTNTTAKYGAQSSGLSASAIALSPVIVPRST